MGGLLDIFPLGRLYSVGEKSPHGLSFLFLDNRPFFGITPVFCQPLRESLEVLDAELLVEVAVVTPPFDVPPAPRDEVADKMLQFPRLFRRTLLLPEPSVENPAVEKGSVLARVLHS